MLFASTFRTFPREFSPLTTGGGSDRRRSYLHGHSGLSRASSRHSRRHGAAGGQRLRYLTRFCPSTRTITRSGAPDSRLQTHIPAGRRSWTGGQHAVVMRPRRVTGTSRTTPIGWPQRVTGVPRPRVTSGPRAPRRPCRSTSRRRASCAVPLSASLDARGAGGAATRTFARGGTRSRERPRPSRAAARGRRACRSGRVGTPARSPCPRSPRLPMASADAATCGDRTTDRPAHTRPAVARHGTNSATG